MISCQVQRIWSELIEISVFDGMFSVCTHDLYEILVWQIVSGFVVVRNKLC